MKVLIVARHSLHTQYGGDTLQIEQTAKYLELLNHQVDITTESRTDASGYDVIHLFNIIRPAQLLFYLKFKKPIVITSIYVDYSEFERKHSLGLRKLWTTIFGKNGIEYLKVCARWVKGSDSFPGYKYLIQGHFKSIKSLVENAAMIITASEQEYKKLEKDFKISPTYKTISLGSEHLKVIPRNDSSKQVLCIGRIEGLKNQVQLINASNEENFSLKLIGEITANQRAYGDYCQNIAGPNIHFVGPKDRQEIAQELSESHVHALVSYYETTGLATLEALKAGCQVVISDRGAQKEIFGDHAHYADPDDIDSIRDAILNAFEDKVSHKAWVEENFSWQSAARQISDIYETIVVNNENRNIRI